MIAFLQYLFAFVLSLELPAAERPVFDPGGGLIVLAVFGGAAALAGRWLRTAVSHSPETGVPLLAGASNAGRLAALGCFWAVAQTYGGCRAPERLGIEPWILVPHLVRLAPFFLLLAIVRAAVHHAGTALAARPPSLVRSLLLDAKMAMLPAAPLFVVALFSDLSTSASRESAWGRAWLDYGGLPSVRSMLGLLAAFGILLIIPSVLRRVWRCRPLPAGPLRDRLEAYARRTGFRAREILVWPTGGEHANAAVVGLLPRFRYVFLTDGLLATLAPGEIEAVFAHEAGHARRGHLLLFLGYTSLLGFAGFLPGVVLGPLEDAVAPLPFAVRAILVVFVWFGLVFGWISRRFEQEADVWGIETVRAPETADPPQDAAAVAGSAAAAVHPFASALERIAVAAGGIREMTGWRHYSIAERVEFVRRYLSDAGVRTAYRRQILLIRGTLIVLVAAAVTAAVTRIPGDLRDAQARGMLEEVAGAIAAPSARERAVRFARAARAAGRTGRGDAALRWYAEAFASDGASLTPDDLRDWATHLELAPDRPLGAAAAWTLLANRADAPDDLRAEARTRAAAVPPRDAGR